tara:strand:+ start:1734 stop:2078 length:345 start_codon:yes stop_codon:yes gene_type:complete
MATLKENIIFDKIQGKYRVVVTKDKYNLIVCAKNKTNKDGNPVTLNSLLTMDNKDYFTSVEGLLTGVYRKRLKLTINKIDLAHMQRIVNDAYIDVLEIARGISDKNTLITRNED